MSKKKGVLKKQRLKKGKRKKPNKVLRRLLFSTLTICLIVVGGYYLKNHIPTMSFTLADFEFHEVNPNASVSITSETKSRMSEEEKVRAIKSVKKGLKQKKALFRIAKSIHQRQGFERVSITSTSEDSVVVFVKKREPYISLQADKHRYVTEQGQVYGKVDGTFEGPVLTGVFSKKSTPYKLHRDNSLILTNSERQRILQAIELSKMASEKELSIDRIEFRDYRGFFISLNGNFQNIAMGFPPFNLKFERLLTILSTLKEKGVTSARIELDFEGKAFIKEVKL